MKKFAFVNLPTKPIDVLKFDIYRTKAEGEIYRRNLHRSQSGWQHGVLVK